MKATLKYFWVVAALIVVQVGLGAVTAHYGVEGDGFYGIPAEQMAALLGGAHLAHAARHLLDRHRLAGDGLVRRPRRLGLRTQSGSALGVNFLFVCLLIIVVGSLAGEWLGVQQKLGFVSNFWFGHQGYEYVDLGRFWQIFLFVGLFVWLFLMARALWPAFRNPGPNRHLLALFIIASAAIGLFYGAGLMWGRQTHLAMAEYWRWWVVHLWVEGFFEVFATVVIAFLFTRMGLLQVATATAAVIFSTIIFLAGGILGTMHHLYFTGTPTAVLALGASFSALEIVPLVLIGFEAYENLTLSPGATLGGGLSLADLLLRGGGVLEPRRRGPVRLPHQSAHRPLLHAGPEHHAGSRPHRAVRRLRHAGHRPDALLPARPDPAGALENPRRCPSASGRSTSAWR